MDPIEQIIDIPEGFNIPYKLDLLGQNTPVTIIPQEEIRKEFPPSVYSFKTINELTKETLKHIGRFSYDKIAVFVNSKD